MESKYGLTIIKVNDEIRKVAHHGKEPKLSNKNQTDASYRACIPCAGKKATGFVAFPKNTCTDHPLIKESMTRGSKGASSFALNNRIKLDKANGRGTLSDECREEIMTEIIIPKTMKVIEDRHPLFSVDRNGTIIRSKPTAPTKEITRKK